MKNVFQNYGSYNYLYFLLSKSIQNIFQIFSQYFAKFPPNVPNMAIYKYGFKTNTMVKKEFSEVIRPFNVHPAKP